MKKLFLLLLLVVLTLPSCVEATDEIPEMTTPDIENPAGETDEDDDEDPIPPTTGG